MWFLEEQRFRLLDWLSYIWRVIHHLYKLYSWISDECVKIFNLFNKISKNRYVIRDKFQRSNIINSWYFVPELLILLKTSFKPFLLIKKIRIRKLAFKTYLSRFNTIHLSLATSSIGLFTSSWTDALRLSSSQLTSPSLTSLQLNMVSGAFRTPLNASQWLNACQ